MPNVEVDEYEVEGNPDTLMDDRPGCGTDGLVG
jgi:hypothetical protein